MPTPGVSHAEEGARTCGGIVHFTHSLPCAGRLLVIPGSSLFPTPVAAAREMLLSMLLSVKSWNLLASAASVLSVLPHKQLRAIGLQGTRV